ncbi:MAG TPA: FAD-dependent oxidoreductase [Candidatus Woesebacteria bacterium]|nr:FAD-dependent oxidoreductase [Candidatus Woesebacteria bacterium]
MKIAVVGGGFTGVACALSLLEKGVEVVLFEEGEKLGGLAGGFNQGTWKWDLEFFYHHVFTNDKEIAELARKVDWPVEIKSPLTTSYLKGKEIQLDTPLSVLRFSQMSLWGRVRMGLGLLILKMIPNGLFLEKYKVTETLPGLIGKEGYRVIWGKLIKAKFGPYTEKVNMAWFWARVAKRSSRLGYFEGGFQKLADKSWEKITNLGGKIKLKEKVAEIKPSEGKWLVNKEKFDGVVVTTQMPIAKDLLEGVEVPKIDYLWGQTLVLETSNKLINGYWMNILEDKWPFLVAVEHTNMIDKKNYDDNRIVYLGNYLPEDSKQLKMSKEELLEMYLPFLRKINKNFHKKWIKNVFLFRKPYSQPVFPVNYSRQKPTTKTKYPGLYIANMSMVYPFDRGTNYAVKMGNEVAKQVLTDLR